jgi:anti-anti-sigma factor
MGGLSELSEHYETAKVAITIDVVPARVIVKIVGELDVDAELTMKAAVNRGTARPNAASMLLVDVAGVSSVDASGLRSLMFARQAALDRGLGFELRAPLKGTVRKRLTQEGLASLLEPAKPAQP